MSGSGHGCVSAAAAQGGSTASPDSTADVYCMKGWKGEGSMPTVRVSLVILCRPNIRRDLILSDIQHHSWFVFFF